MPYPLKFQRPRRTREVRVLSAALVGALLQAPRLALACPSCAANPDAGPARYLLVGLMILAPYVIAVVILRLVRQGEAALRADDPGEVVDETSRTPSP